MYSSSGEPCNFIIRAWAASSGECILTEYTLSPPLTILIGTSKDISAVSQSFPPLVTTPVALDEFVGSTPSAKPAPPTPSNFSSWLNLIGSLTSEAL